MTGRLRAVSISPTRLGRRIGGVLVSAIALCAVMAPAPAYAWWGWLEKMSGPSGLNGPQIEVRAVCFGDRHDDVKRAGSLAAEAARLTPIANRSKDPDWEGVADRWMEAATTWASILGETPPPDIGRGKDRADYWKREAEGLEHRGRVYLIATSSAGVIWSLCGPDRKRRLALDVGWGVWGNDGDPDIASGQAVKLQTLMTYVSWRLLADTKWDYFDLSSGGGSYWFSSTAFPSKSGLVLQPVRVTFRAPASWSNPAPNGKHTTLKRWAAVPVGGVAMTVFPGGFEPGDFGRGRGASRIPAEKLLTGYFFLNLQPLVQMARN